MLILCSFKMSLPTSVLSSHPIIQLVYSLQVFGLRFVCISPTFVPWSTHCEIRKLTHLHLQPVTLTNTDSEQYGGQLQMEGLCFHENENGAMQQMNTEVRRVGVACLNNVDSNTEPNVRKFHVSSPPFRKDTFLKVF
jgi:hypothetical protein